MYTLRFQPQNPPSNTVQRKKIKNRWRQNNIKKKINLNLDHKKTKTEKFTCPHSPKEKQLKHVKHKYTNTLCIYASSTTFGLENN